MIGPHPVLHFCNGQMGGCMGHSCHVFFSTRFTRSKRLENGQQSTEMMLCFPGFAQERCACVALA
jgi:hypothetical protein